MRAAGTTHSALTNTALHQESHFIKAVCGMAAADGYRGLVLHSDPVERWTAAEVDDDGNVIVPARRVKRGHFGISYQSAGAIFTGATSGGAEWHLPDSSVFNRRAAQKVRKQEPGHRYAEKQLIKWGARPIRAGEKPAEWLAEALPAAHARKVRDPGKLRYLIPLGTSRRGRAAARREIAYPARPHPKPYLGQLELFSPDGREA
jgi:hypothetical protein